jgi:hypothetical protein
MDITTEKIVHRITINSHDRTNFNDETSDFTVNLEQISNARCFALRRALLPLSSYTFEEGDPDAQLVIHNDGLAPNGQFMLGGDQIHLNGFVVPNTTVIDQVSTFPTGDPASISQITFCYYKVFPLNRIQLRCQDQNGITQVVNIPALDNSTGTEDLIFSPREFIDHVNQTIAFKMGQFYGVLYETYASLQVSTYRGYDNEPQNKPENYTLTKYIDSPDMPFNYFYYAYMRSDPVIKSQRFELWKMSSPADTVGLRIVSFENINIDNKLSSNAVQFQYLSAKQTISRTLPANTIYPIDSIPSVLNDAWIDWAHFTYQVFNPSVEWKNHRLTMRKEPMTGQFIWEKAIAVFLPNVKLGIKEITFTQEYPDGITAAVALAQDSVNLYPGIIFFSYAVGNPSIPTNGESMRLQVNSLISQYDMEFATNLYYPDQLSINNLPLRPVEDVAPWDVLNKRVYGFRFMPSTNYDWGGVKFGTSPIAPFDYTPFSYWENDNAAFVPHGNGADNSWCLNQRGYTQSNTYPPTTITFPTDVSLTLANLQTGLNLLTGLVATIDTTKNTVNFNNPTANFFRIEANQRLGIFDKLTVNQDFYIDAFTQRETGFPIDIAPRNTVLSIGLSIYHDGRTAISYPKGVDKSAVRPLRRNVVATVYNSTQVNYGQYIVYADESNTWLPCQDKNISHIRVQIYNDQMGVIDLHSKELFLEIDVLADVL